MQRPRQAGNRGPAPRTGRQTAVGPGDRRDGQALIFGWGRHLTRAQKQRYRQRFVLAAGLFVFVLVAIVIGVGAIQQYVLKPRYVVAKVNGDTITLDWYQKNLSYTQYVLQTEALNAQNQLQALQANVSANAQATATAEGTPAPGSTPAASASGAASGASASGSAAGAGSSSSSASGSASAAAGASTAGSASASAGASGAPTETPQPTNTPTPEPTLNPTQSATAQALQQTLSSDNDAYQAAQEQTVEDLTSAALERQNAAKFGISVSKDDVSAQEKKISDQLGGSSGLQQLFSQAHIGQGDLDQIAYNAALKDKYQAYFAANPNAAPSATPTSVPSPTPTSNITGPEPPVPTPVPTPPPAPGSDSLARWLQQQETSGNIYRAPFPLPS